MAVSGTLAVLIPPSIILILYGVITGESIGSLYVIRAASFASSTTARADRFRVAGAGTPCPSLKSRLQQ